MPIGVNLLSGFVSMLGYILVVFSAYKVFTMASEIKEMKDILRDIRRNQELTPIASVPSSAESLVRAVNAASYSDIIEDAIRSEPQR